MKNSRAKRKKTKTAIPIGSLIKVKLDERTIITIKKMEIFKFWKERYPNAEIIS